MVGITGVRIRTARTGIHITALITVPTTTGLMCTRRRTTTLTRTTITTTTTIRVLDSDSATGATDSL